jgi:hypothetical protein
LILILYQIAIGAGLCPAPIKKSRSADGVIGSLDFSKPNYLSHPPWFNFIQNIN